MGIPTNFNRDTTGVEVVKAFADQVEGKTFVVTGASVGGLGAYAVAALATANPKQIILAARSESKVAPVIEQIRSLNPSITTSHVPLNLTNLSSLRSTAAAICALAPTIDVLINNAGIMAVEKYATTDDGFESQFGCNHVGPFLLTCLLIKEGRIGKGGRVVGVTSMGYEMSGIRWGNEGFGNGTTYNPWLAYGQSKTANILFTTSLATKLFARGASAFVVHPGLITSSNLMNNVSQEMFMDGMRIAKEVNDGDGEGESGGEAEEPKTLERGCATHLVAALGSGLEEHSGAFLVDCQIKKDGIKAHALGDENAERLWKLSEELVGEKFEF